MHKNILAAGALLGGLGVALGAFGAHGLQKLTTDATILHGYQTGVQYQVYHALTLLAVGILAAKAHSGLLKWSAIFFIAGTFLFSGSLYLLTFLKIQNSTAIKWVGPVTPLGGVCFITGWLLLLLAVKKSSAK
ncbi:MAG: DUF423 domain-containing protein [Bacteroidetes bacterium]|nr:DUF423 domain-containing protein [Bacteroidota bacterium]